MNDYISIQTVFDTRVEIGDIKLSIFELIHCYRMNDIKGTKPHLYALNKKFLQLTTHCKERIHNLDVKNTIGQKTISLLKSVITSSNDARIRLNSKKTNLVDAELIYTIFDKIYYKLFKNKKERSPETSLSICV